MMEDAYISFIKRHPGCSLNKIASEFSGIDREHIKKSLVPLEINGELTRIASRYWYASDHPNLAPKLNSILYSIKKNKHGVTLDQLADQLGLPKSFVREEITFLLNESRIYVQNGFIHAMPFSEKESERSRFLIGELQLLSRNELVGIASRLLETATYLLSEYETINQIIQERKQEVANLAPPRPDMDGSAERDRGTNSIDQRTQPVATRPGAKLSLDFRKPFKS
jgi:hypothetical protein